MLTCSNHRRIARPSSRHQQGSSLIEVLVTFLILSFGMLALGSLQAYSVATTTSSSKRAVALTLANEFAEVMRANPDGFKTGAYDKAVAFNPNDNAVQDASGQSCAYPACTPATLAAFDAAVFDARMKASIRAATYAVVRPTIAGVTSTNQADVWLIWPEAQTFTDRGKDNSGGDTGATEKNFDNCPNALKNNSPLPRCLYMRVTL